MPSCRTTYDAIIIGAGHNGLVTAAYLAKAGYKVLVLERRDVVGGCCITEELWPGFKVSTAAYVNSLLRPEIIRDLELKKYGFEMLPRSPSSFTPFPDGRYLMMGPDKEMTHREIAKFSHEGRRGTTRSTRTMLTRVADFLEPMLTQTPPDPFSRPARRPLEARPSSGWQFRGLGRDVADEAVEILTGAARPILDRWFESERTEGDDRHRRGHRRVRRRRRTRARPTCCSTTSWASATASAACGATSAAAWATISNSIAGRGQELRGARSAPTPTVGQILVKRRRGRPASRSKDGTEFHAPRRRLRTPTPTSPSSS